MFQDLSQSNTKSSLSLHDRSFDLILLSNWEDQIIYEPTQDEAPSATEASERANNMVTAPINHVLEDGTWTRSIIWDTKTPFRDFTQLEVNMEDETNEEKFAGIFSILNFFAHNNSFIHRSTSEEED